MDLSISTLAAFSLGMAHALEPGHGKSLMAVALIGSKRKWRDPITLAISSALSHSLSIAIFSVLSFTIAHQVASEDFLQLIEVGAGIIILGLGLIRLYRAVNGDISINVKTSCKSCCSDKHGCDQHSQINNIPLLGFLIGFVPCPTVLALSLSAVNAGSIQQVTLFTIIFGAGIASTLCLIGVSLTHLQSSILQNRSSVLNRFVTLISPILVCCIGLIMLIHAVADKH